MGFERNETGNTLHNHLIKDGMFENDRTLKIIDDYHTKEITDDAIAFYSEAFMNTNLRKIIVYYQIRLTNWEIKNQIRDLANRLQINENELITFLTFLFTSLNLRRDNIESRLIDLYRSGKANRIINTSLRFIDSLRFINIELVYQPYDALNLKPPFHGRYWLNNEMGYIVDASLNTFSHARIFAQIMDRENFNIIHDLLVSEIMPRSCNYAALNKERLLEIHHIVSNYLRR